MNDNGTLKTFGEFRVANIYYSRVNDEIKIKPHLKTLWNEVTKDRTGLEDVKTMGLSFGKKEEAKKPTYQEFMRDNAGTKPLAELKKDFEKLNSVPEVKPTFREFLIDNAGKIKAGDMKAEYEKQHGGSSKTNIEKPELPSPRNNIQFNAKTFLTYRYKVILYILGSLMKNKKTIFTIILNVIYISSIIILAFYIRYLILQNNELKVQLANQNEEIIKIQKNANLLKPEIKYKH